MSEKSERRKEHRKNIYRSSVRPALARKPVYKPISRYITFLVGIAATFLVYLLMHFLLGLKLEMNAQMRFGVFVIVFLLVFVCGLGKVAGKKSPEEIKSDKGKNPEKDIEAGFVGVVKAFDAPLPVWMRFVLPAGDSWLPPFICEHVSIDMREQAWDVPPTEADEGFEIQSISDALVDGNVEGTKYVPMRAKVRIRFRVFDPYKWYAQDQKSIERTLVNFVVRTMRHVASNGNYPVEGRKDRLKITSDFNLMQQKDELGQALSEDVRVLSRKAWGIDVMDVIVRRLMPSDPGLVKEYERVAKELAQFSAESIEGKVIRKNAKAYAADGATPEEALMYAALSAGKGSLETIKGVGGARAFLGINTPKPKNQSGT